MPPPLTSYIVPANAIPDAKKGILLEQVKDALYKHLYNKVGIEQSGAVIRDGRPNFDFALANDRWITGALAANTAAAYVNSALANNKVVAFYKVYNEDPAPSIYRLRFMPGLAGAARSIVELEQLYSLLESEGWFSTPVFFFPTEVVYIETLGRAVKAAGELLGFGVLVAEPIGQVSPTPE